MITRKRHNKHNPNPKKRKVEESDTAIEDEQGPIQIVKEKKDSQGLIYIFETRRPQRIFITFDSDERLAFDSKDLFIALAQQRKKCPSSGGEIEFVFTARDNFHIYVYKLKEYTSCSAATQQDFQQVVYQDNLCTIPWDNILSDTRHVGVSYFLLDNPVQAEPLFVPSGVSESERISNLLSKLINYYQGCTIQLFSQHKGKYCSFSGGGDILLKMDHQHKSTVLASVSMFNTSLSPVKDNETKQCGILEGKLDLSRQRDTPLYQSYANAIIASVDTFLQSILNKNKEEIMEISVLSSYVICVSAVGDLGLWKIVIDLKEER